MKRKIIFVLLIACISLVTLVGCSKEEIEDVTNEWENNSLSVLVQMYGDAGSLLIKYSTGEEEETGAVVWEASEGTKISDIMTEWEISSIEPVCEDDSFDGWLKYKETTTTDEYGFVEFNYQRLSDNLYTTEEILKDVMPDYSITYIAKCKNISLEDIDI